MKATKKRGRGRPGKEWVRVHLSMLPRTAKLLTKLATAAGLSKTAFVEQLVIDAAARFAKPKVVE